MKIKPQIKNIIMESICLLFILLFVYAAISKILDFEKFQVQLSQSPLLSAFAVPISWTVPLIELLTAVALVLPRFRKAALYTAFSLMTMFTVYIYTILHYSSFVPCSCGGVLQKMSWNAHLIFNITFVIMAVVAIIFDSQLKCSYSHNSIKRPILSTAIIAAGTTLVIVILFLLSEDIMQHNNPFLRKYPNHPAKLVKTKDLKYNSYYFAGSDKGRIYLGNYTNPSVVMSLNENLEDQKNIKINFDPKEIPFKMVTIAVRDSSFFLFDGSVPIYFRGDLKSWRVRNEFKGIPYFTKAIPIDGTSVVVRSNNAVNSANILAVYKNDVEKTVYKKDLLQKQVDGIFDTDGMLLYSEGLNRIIYVYYYRNEFLLAAPNGDLDYRGNTIDTIKHVKLKVRSIKNDMQRAMSSPSFIVNAQAGVYKNLLFIHSKIKGNNEIDKLWERSFIIDVYDLKKKSYILSFPVYHFENQRLNSFIVTGDNLYALINTNVVQYKFNTVITNHIQ